MTDIDNTITDDPWTGAIDHLSRDADSAVLADWLTRNRGEFQELLDARTNHLDLLLVKSGQDYPDQDYVRVQSAAQDAGIITLTIHRKASLKSGTHVKTEELDDALRKAIGDAIDEPDEAPEKEAES